MSDLSPEFMHVMGHLRQPIDPAHVSQKRVQGNTIDYVSVWTIQDYLDSRAPGWSWRVTSVIPCPYAGKRDDNGQPEGLLFLTGELTIRAGGTELTMAATGHESLAKVSYGDPVTNAEATALRRAAARFGFTRDLWRKE